MNSGEESVEAILERLKRRKKAPKEIESTVEGEPPLIVDALLPSFFDWYPRPLVAIERAKTADRDRLIRACDRVLWTGDEADMHRITSEVLGAGDVVVMNDDDDDKPPKGFFQWAADGGDAGWLDYDPIVNDLIEDARIKDQPVASFSMFGGAYRLDFNQMLQSNLHSTTVRPVKQRPK